MKYLFTFVKNETYGTDGDFDSAICSTRDEIERILTDHMSVLNIEVVDPHCVQISPSDGSSSGELPFSLEECKRLLKNKNAFVVGRSDCPYTEHLFAKVNPSQSK